MFRTVRRDALADSQVTGLSSDAPSTTTTTTSLPAPARRTTVLVVGTDQWAIEQAVGQLCAAGRVVQRCHEPEEAPFPCNALIEGRQCPLDVGVDVVLDVRARPVSPPSLGEFGVVCAQHAGVPLVVAGVAWDGGFAPWAAERVEQGVELPAACDAAAESVR